MTTLSIHLKIAEYPKWRAAFDDMALRATGKKFDAANTVYPNVNDGVEGMFFIQQCVASSAKDGNWVPLKHPSQSHD